MPIFPPPAAADPARELTPKQRAILAFILDYIRTVGYPPAIRDIGRAFGIGSPNGVMCHLRALQKKGVIHRDEKSATRSGRARAITLPGGPAGSIPLLGRVAAGVPAAAVAEPGRLDLRSLFGGDDDDTFALRVRGESMIEAHIADGDYVVVRRAAAADNGDTVVAMVDGETTLKTWRRTAAGIRLVAANGAFRDIVVDPAEQDVRVLGVLVGVVRRLPH